MQICEYCGKSGVHPECDAQAATDLQKRQVRCAELASTLALHGVYGVALPESKTSLLAAEKVLGEHLGYLPEYKIEQVIEGDEWWFIPASSFGRIGYVVEKSSQSIYPLGWCLVSLHGSQTWPSPWCAIREYLAGNVQASKSDA